MKYPHINYQPSLIISRLQQVEIANLKPSMAVDSPFFHLITIASLKPFFDNLPINLELEFRLIGSKILGLQVTRGYFCQDLETSLHDLVPVEALTAVGRLNMACPIFYQAAFYSALVKLTGWPEDKERPTQFTIAMEFARIAHHLQVVKNVLYCLNLDSLAEIAEDCEQVLQPPCQLFNRIRAPGDDEVSSISLEEIDEILSDAYLRAEELSSAISFEEGIRAALHKKAVVSLTQAGFMGLTGPYLRANQEIYDLRRQSDRGIVYLKPPRISIGDGGDALTRFSLRPMDILASLKWLKQMVLSEAKASSLKAIVIDESFGQKAPIRPFAFGEIEGPEGDIKVSMFVDAKGQSPIFRIRSPAYFIAQAIPHMLNQTDLSDVAALLYSLGITAEEVDK